MLEQKTDESIWAFISSLLFLIETTAKNHSKRLGYVELDNIINHLALQLFRRFRKELDRETFYVRNKLKGYIAVCVYGEIQQARRKDTINALSFDEVGDI
ncbi:MAG: hypothetical protein FWC64_06965 [Treponema sp.]|nr:hypothetical protein [Treponema sp.]